MIDKKQPSNELPEDRIEEYKKEGATSETPIFSSEDPHSNKNVQTKKRSKINLKTVILKLQAIENSLSATSQMVETLERQQGIMQNSMRQLGTRVADAATSLGAPRIRELYMRLLLIYDLVEPAPLHLSEESVSLCKLIATQIEQFLEANGIKKIDTNGSVFDPILHKPVKIISEDDSGKDGCIVSTVRNGFRSERAVLRPAEVVIVRTVQEPSKLQEDTSSEDSIRQEEPQNHCNTETNLKEKEERK